MTEFQYWIFLFFVSLSLGVAWWSVCISRRNARQRATLEFINHYNSDARVLRGHRVVRSAQTEDVDDLLKKSTDENNTRDDFLFLMNLFETLAIGLKHKIYDKKMVEDAFGRDICQIYNQSSRLITYIRDNESDSEAFVEFESIARNIKSSHKLPG